MQTAVPTTPKDLLATGALASSSPRELLPQTQRLQGRRELGRTTSTAVYSHYTAPCKCFTAMLRNLTKRSPYNTKGIRLF